MSASPSPCIGRCANLTPDRGPRPRWGLRFPAGHPLGCPPDQRRGNVMIGYATIGTNDLERATKFYDAVLEPLGGKRTFANGERMQFYGSKDTLGMIAISKPYDEQPATAGNGS